MHEECEKEIIMQKYLANFVVTTNVSSEIQADSIEEAIQMPKTNGLKFRKRKIQRPLRKHVKWIVLV